MGNYYQKKLQIKRDRGIVPLLSSSHSHDHTHTLYKNGYDFAIVNFVTMTCPICGTYDIQRYSSRCPVCGTKFFNRR